MTSVVRCLLAFNHNPTHDDDSLDARLGAVADTAAATVRPAWEGLAFTLG